MKERKILKKKRKEKSEIFYVFVIIEFCIIVNG